MAAKKKIKRPENYLEPIVVSPENKLTDLIDRLTRTECTPRCQDCEGWQARCPGLASGEDDDLELLGILAIADEAKRCLRARGFKGI